MPGTGGTQANPRRVTEGAPLPWRQKLLQRAKVLSRFGRLKYSMASRSRLGMQISNGESYVPAPGLILYPDSRSSTSPLPSSHFLWRALSSYPSSPFSSPSCVSRWFPLKCSSVFLQRNFLISPDTREATRISYY